MTKARLILLALSYMAFGLVAGLGAIDNDPVVKIISVIVLMGVTMGVVYEIWRYLFK